MSGPKIVDIAATRKQERIRIGTLCARIEALIGTLDGQLGNIDEKMTERIKAEAEAAESIYPLLDLRAKAEQQLAFVRSEAKRHRQEVRERVACESAANQAVDEMIEQLMRDCPDEAVRQKLESAREEASAAEKLRLYEEARDELRQEETKVTVSVEELRRWMEELGNPELENIAPPAAMGWRQEIERMRSELAAVENPSVTARLEEGVREIEAETNEERRRLLLDGLRFDLSDHLAAARERESRLAQIAEWQAAIGQFEGLDQEAWTARLVGAVELESEAFRELGQEVEAEIEAETKREAARHAREVVLATLEGMGYEVRPGMETALVEEGRIVLRKPNEETYGVELSTLPSGDPSLIKTQVVRMRGQQAATPDALQADKEHEDEWCAETQSMNAALEEQGITATIKASRPAGEKPVAAVTEEEGSQDQSRRVSRPRTQQAE